MTALNTRARIAILTVVVTVAHVVLQQVNLSEKLNFELEVDLISPLALALIIYLGTLWVLFFKVRGERFITVLAFPALSVFALSLLTEFIIASVFGGLGQFGILFFSALIHFVLTYFTLLTVNILNTAHLKEIPLGQAGRAAQFVLTLIIAYVYFFILFSNTIPVFVRCSIVAVVVWLLVYISLWSINLKANQRAIAALNIALLIALAALALSIWPVGAPYLALVLTLVLYITLGIALEIREIISKWIIIEYVSLFGLMLFMLLVVAKWGINGYVINL